MLLTKEVEVKWHKSNRDWYINKGYKYTKMKDVFIIKVEDLSYGSQIRVVVKCDCCGKEFTTTWQTYQKCLHGEKYYCIKCSHKIFGADNRHKTQLKNSKSFEQWCIDNNRQDILDRWDYELNICNPNEITFSNGKRYYFKCSKNIHKSELKNISSITSHPNSNIISSCVACNSIGQKLIDLYGNNAIDLYWDFNLNKVSPYKINYGSEKDIWIKCQEKDYHGSYKTTPSRFILQNQRCSYCNKNGGKVHPKDSLGQLLEDKGLLHLWSNKNKKSPYEYTPFSLKEVYWVCARRCHSDYKRRISDSNKCNFRCPKCILESHNSILEEKVIKYLNSLTYSVLHEKYCTIKPKNPKTKMSMPFDNEIKELKLIIEVHGEQHYKQAGWHILHAKRNKTTPQYELHMIQVRDRYKRIFAKMQGYFYLEIPYWTDDENETWKELIYNKINNITVCHL